MSRPKCQEPNADDAVQCAKCGETLRSAATDSIDVVTARPRISRKAIASLVFGIIGLLWLRILVGFSLALLMDAFAEGFLVGGLLVALVFSVPWLLAILLGRSAWKDIRISSGQVKGIGLARAGIVLGAFDIGLAVLLSSAEMRTRIPAPFVRRAESRARTDMRSLATAIEAYFVDSNIYPPWAVGVAGPGGAWSYNHWIASKRHAAKPHRTWFLERIEIGPLVWYRRQDVPSPADFACFALRGRAPGQIFGTLTTPMSYITTYPDDLFSPTRGATFVYWSVWPGKPDPAGKIPGKDSPVGGVGWILVSPGPDSVYDIPEDPDVYNPAVSQPSPRLLAGTNRKGNAFTYDPTNGTFSRGDVYRVKQ